MVTRPSLEEVHAYRAHVDERDRSARSPSGALDEAAQRVLELGLHHEQQHQELMLTDLKHALGTQPLRPAYRDDLAAPRRRRDRARSAGSTSRAAWSRSARASAASRSTTSGRATASSSSRSRSRRVPCRTPRCSRSSPTAATASRACGSRDGFARRAARGLDRAALLGAARRRVDALRRSPASARSIPRRPRVTSATTRPTRSRAGPARACRPRPSGSTPPGIAAPRRATSPTTIACTRARATRRRPARSCSATSGSGRSSAYAPYPGFRPLRGRARRVQRQVHVAASWCCAAARASRRAVTCARAIATSSPPSARWQMTGVRLARRSEDAS